MKLRERDTHTNSIIDEENTTSNLETNIGTAYVGEGATTYDELRFTSVHGRVFHKLEQNQLSDAVSALNFGATVLEVGCGTARFSQYLAEKGFNVVALDPSEDMLQLARKKCFSLKNIEFVRAEGASLQFSDCTFDFVFAIRVINSIESEEYAIQTIKEMIRVTKKNGMILIEFANKSRPLAKKNNSIRLSFNQIRKVAKSNECIVIKESGVLVFSQTILNILPSFLLPFWKNFELLSAKILWRYTSRGYVIFRKKN